MGHSNLKLVEGLDNDPDEEYPLLPEGKYVMSYESHYTRWLHNTSKLQIVFRVQDIGPYFQKRMSRYYNVSINGKPKKNGPFRASKMQDVWLELSRVLPFSRGDRIPVTHLSNFLVEVKVRTVIRNAKQKKRNERSQYSVIDEVLGKAE